MLDIDNVKQLLSEIELTMKDSEIWSNEQLPESAFHSREPFCIDSMTATQWLQWVFIPKMNHLIANQLPLPTRFALAPYFEETLSEEHRRLLILLQELDLLLNRESQ
jgi:uncharacterized protein YqcC (DUF446 family)